MRSGSPVFERMPGVVRSLGSLLGKLGNTGETVNARAHA